MDLFNKSGHDRNKLLQSILKCRRYHALGMAGEGGIAQVTSFFDVYLNRVVAIKELKQKSLDSPDLIRSFINESKMIGYLDHPGVVPIYDAFVLDENRFSYSMKFIEGYSLASELKRRKNSAKPGFSIAESVKIITKVGETLAYVHDKGVIHLDLKPENVMLGSYGQVMVMDWGNARLYDNRPFDEYINAFSGNPDFAHFYEEREDIILGTPGYMSPEQTSMPRTALTPASDIFSAGVFFYQMLTGIHPFEAASAESMMHNICNLHQPMPNRYNPEIPRRLSAICQKMLEKRIPERYNSFNDVLQDLNEFSDYGHTFATQLFGPGETIVTEGEEGEFAFLIVKGRVQVSMIVDGRHTVLDELGEGEIAGELAIFSRQKRSATVTAIEPTIIRIMNKTDVESELEKLAPWVGNMVSALSDRFSKLSQRLGEISSRNKPQT
jgi:serine/threonine-protein kinase